MELHYDPDTDRRCVEFTAAPGIGAHAVSNGPNIDLDPSGYGVGCDIDQTSPRQDLFTLETASMPLQSKHAGALGI